MKSFSEISSSRLILENSESDKKIFDLKDNSEIVAQLEFMKFWGSLAEVHTTEQVWSLKRTGFWQNKITVRKKGEEQNVAIIPYSYAKIEYISSDGTHLFLKNTSVWNSEWCWVTTENQNVIEYRLTNCLECSGGLTINESFKEKIPNLLLIAMIGWYILILIEEDTEASTVAIISSTGAM